MSITKPLWQCLALAFALWFPLPLRANNIVVSNPSVASVDTANGYAMLQFDLSWENSWRDTVNWDAAWVCLKFRGMGGTGPWGHATLHYVDGTNDGHFAPSGSTIRTPADGKGIFLHRDAAGAGNVAYAGIQVRWDYAADGVTAPTTMDVRVLATEMVYIPQGSFFLGDARMGNPAGQFEAGTTGAPFQVTGEGSLTLGGGNINSLGNNNRSGMANNGLFSISPISIDDFNDTVSQTLPAAFPKGYNAFYIMKYELTQEEYVLFLNALDSLQFQTRYNSINGNINGTTGSNWNAQPNRFNLSNAATHPNLVSASPNVPMIFIEAYDGAAYADWIGLRPLTETEFEKACRGNQAAVPDEYAWGTTAINGGNYFPLVNQDQPDEGVISGYSLTEGNAWYNVTMAGQFPLRVGAFAAHAGNTGRVTAGASYYGVMELSGNCWERTVSLGRPIGRGFTGSHGDGYVNAAGNADNLDWPGYVTGVGVSMAEGYGYRGGGFDFPQPVVDNLRVSSRIVATAFYNAALYDDSIRFVRTAP